MLLMALPASEMPSGLRCGGRAARPSARCCRPGPGSALGVGAAGRQWLSAQCCPDHLLLSQTPGLPSPRCSGCAAPSPRLALLAVQQELGARANAATLLADTPGNPGSWGAKGGRRPLLALAWAWPPWPVGPGSLTLLLSATRRVLDGTVAATGRTLSSTPSTPTAAAEVRKA